MTGILRNTTMGLVTAAVLGLSACASVPDPTGEMATARSAVENARREGAGQFAGAELNEAQDRLTMAERAQVSEDYEIARRAAEQARVMADLAGERARLAKAAQAKAELDKTIQALRGQVTTPATR